MKFKIFISLVILIPIFSVGQIMSNNPLTTCSGVYLDPGGNSPYTSNLDFTQTITPDNGGKLSITFTSFTLESNTGCTWDYLEIYNGPSTGSPLLGRFCGSTNPGTFTSTAANGELTFKFHSDGSGNYAGWSANLSCTAGTPMVYNQTTASSANNSITYQGLNDQEIIKVNVQTTGGASPLVLSNLTTRITGSTSINDISQIKVYYTGSINSFSTSNLFGSAAPIASPSDINIGGSQTLVNGNNYFWIVYDIAVDPTSTVGNTVDALCTEVVVDGINRSCSPTGPFGGRLIQPLPASFQYYIDQAWGKDVVYRPSDDTYVIAGRSMDPSLTFGGISSDICLFNINGDGTINWSKLYGKNNGYSEEATDIYLLPDNGFLVSGNTGTTNANAVLLRVDSNGNLLWSKEIDADGSTDYGKGAILHSNGDVYFISEQRISFTPRVYIARIDLATGAIIDDRYISGGTACSPNDIIECANGTIMVVGDYNGSNSYVLNFSQTLALNGSLRFNNGELYSIIENAPNDYTVFGTDYSGGVNGADISAMRFTISGATPTVVWANYFGDNNTDILNKAVKSSDGNYVLIGSYSNIGDPFQQEMYALKIGNNGSIIWTNIIGSDDYEGYGIARGPGESYVGTGLTNVSGTDNYYIRIDGQDNYICNSLGTGGTSASFSPTFNTYGTSSSYIVDADLSGTVSEKTVTLIENEVCLTVLGVELKEFYADCNDGFIEIKWSTFTENNNAYFELQKSDNGIDFYTIEIINGAVISTEELNYSFFDYRINSNTTYYKLIMVNTDGTISDEKIIVSHCDLNENLIYPNPFDDEIKVVLSNTKFKTLSLKLLNNLGQVVFENSITKESNEITLDLPELVYGIYYLEINQDNKKSIHKIFKK